jgi:RNA polymerase sigma-70 factor, ECF subfamily
MTEKFEEFYRRHVQAVFRFALSCVGRREIAEEITSEVFVSLLRNLDGIEEDRLEGWLIAVARNRARDYWRHSLTEQTYLTTADPAPEVTQHPECDWLFDNRELKPIHRLCLLLKFRDGMTRSEIARELGITEIQVKGHLQYSLQLLRKAICEEEQE